MKNHSATDSLGRVCGRRKWHTLAVCLVGCALSRIGASAGAGARQVQTVVLSGWVSSPAETAQLERVVAAFEATHPTIAVDYQPVTGNYQQAMEARFAAGDPPDVF